MNFFLYHAIILVETKMKEGDILPSKYPIVLAHGIAAKQLKILNAFGKIGSELEKEGYKVYIADTDGFGSVENNAEQLKRFINNLRDKYGYEKVNIIAHSTGGLDAKYMITKLDMEDAVASLTTFVRHIVDLSLRQKFGLFLCR